MDLLLVTVPRRTPNIQYASVIPEALGRLKATTEAAGFSTTIVDFNIEYFRKAFVRRDIFNEIEEYFQEVETREYLQQKHQLSPAALAFWDELLDDWVARIREANPKHLGVSIFSDHSLRACSDLLEKVRKEMPGLKVILGGLTVSVAYSDSLSVGELLVSEGLADHFISGEGEISLVEFLKGNLKYPGIDSNTFEQIKDLDSIPFSNYEGLNLKNYYMPNPKNLRGVLPPMISVSGSRGCIRSCLFCDVGHFWPKYRWVDPNRLAEELFHYSEEYGIKNFHFSDSIVNASSKHFNIFLDRLIAYQEEKKVTFFLAGQMIVREMPSFGEHMFSKMKQAGFGFIMYGVESGSPSVRISMNKAYSQEALYFTLKMCEKYEINAQAMMIIGYPTETVEDFELTCQLFRDFAPTNLQDVRVTFSISTFTMDQDSKECRLHKEHEKHGIHFDPLLGWVSPVLNRYEALQRTLKAYDLIEKLGFPIYQEWKSEIQRDLTRMSKEISP